MGSFQQPGYMPLAEWDYDGIAQAYPSGYLGNSHSQASGFGYSNDLSAGSSMEYMPHGYGPQSIPAATFHLPSAPASARRQASSQRSTTSVEADEEKHSRRIKRTRTVCFRCRMDVVDRADESRHVKSVGSANKSATAASRVNPVKSKAQIANIVMFHQRSMPVLGLVPYI